jgi:hypothetical protein
MKKLGLAALMLLPFLGGCVAYVPHPYHARYYRPSRVYVAAPAPVVVVPAPPVRRW